MSYAKFLKEILSNTRKLEEHDTIALMEECSAIIQNKMPPKLKDKGSFSIFCLIDNMTFDHALCDVGGSVSLMPLSIYKKLDIGDLKPTTITIQLADHFVKHPIGILEDVPIKADKFFILADFIVLEMEEDSRLPIILSRLFLAMASAIIDAKNGKLTLNVVIDFDLPKSLKKPSYARSCYNIDVLDKVCGQSQVNRIGKDPLEICLLDDDDNKMESEVKIYSQLLNSTTH